MSFLSRFFVRWVNNLLMEFIETPDGHDADSSVERNMVFIDFQFSSWASPTIDLHYFLNSSLEESLRPDCFDDLIAFYHENLVNNLKCIGYKKHIPSLDEFRQQYNERLFYGKSKDSRPTR